MRTLSVFNNITLDGYFSGENGDYSWAHSGKPDQEFNEFVAGNAQGGGTLLLGRKTYEIMAGFWPTAEARKSQPEVAQGMNSMPKVVFSRTLDHLDWENSKLVKGDLVAEVRKLKKESGPDMVILGSGSIVAQLAPEGLIDEYQVVVIPVVIGSGRTMFDGMQKKLELKLTDTRAFKSGKVFMTYAAEG